MAKQKQQQKRPGFFATLRDAYKISRRTYPALGWWLAGVGVLGLAIGVVVGAITKAWVAWIILGVLLALTFPMLLLTRLVRNASYAQLKGVPGATTAVLGNLRGAWITQDKPVRVNARHQDMVFRAIGKPGVVLVAEGPKSRTAKLARDAERDVHHVSREVPVTILFVGDGEGQVPLSKLERTVKRLPSKISRAEVSALDMRLRALGNNALSIPKGIDPLNTKVSRRALRGN